MKKEEIIDYYSKGITDRGGCGGPVIITMFCLLFLFMLTGCKTVEYVPVKEVHTDTTYITKWRRDSVWLHDSVLVREKGDSVLVEKWHTEYVEKLVTDTLYRHIKDTIPQPYPVPADNTAWEKVKIEYGGYAMLLVLAGAVLFILRIKRMII